MKKYNIKSNQSCRVNYAPEILDIWCQGNKIVAYVEGTHIYKTEMIIKNNNIENYYCSCPSSEGGMNFCKHLAGIVYYLKDNEILELEDSPKEEQKIDLSLSSDEILKEFRLRINSLVDRYTGEINCYNSSKYIDIIIEYKEYIDSLLNNNQIKEAFNLVIKMLEVLEHIYVCNEEDYCEGKEELHYYIDNIISDYNYKDEIINYLEEEYKNKEITNTGMDIIDILINDVSTLEEANKIIKLMSNIKPQKYYEDTLKEKIVDLTHDRIGVKEALKLSKKYRGIYIFDRKIIKYLEELGTEEELIKELEKQIASSNRIELSEKLLSIYQKRDDKENAQRILLNMIVKENNIKYYQKLKQISTKGEMIEYTKKIEESYSKKWHGKEFILEMYNEDNKIDKLFKIIKKEQNLKLLKKYKEPINECYHEELLNTFKNLIIKNSTRVSGREEYYYLSHYIKDLYSLNCKEDFVINLLKEMYPYYKAKKAFREEIIKVLSKEDKIKFDELISSNGKEN